jgi:hypothetical protein
MKEQIQIYKRALGGAGCEDLIDLGGFSARFARHKNKQNITGYSRG